jgi:hypothetical protein
MGRAVTGGLDGERQPVLASGDDGGLHVVRRQRLGDHRGPLVQRAAPCRPSRVVRLIAGQVHGPAERPVKVALDGHGA